MSTFDFYLFGPLRLVINQNPISLPPQPAAFCSFLILNRQRRITREEVQVAFWPDAEPARAQERLRRTLYLLRQAIQPHTELITTEGNELEIAPDIMLWVDYEVFEKNLIDAYRQEPPNRHSLENAVTLYKDDLLKDIYADWALLEREHARQHFLTAIRHLIVVCQQNRDWNDVIRYAHALLEQDPLQEIAHRALMTSYSAMGDRSAALRQYQLCVDVLQEELGADPLPETTQLYEDIRQGRGIALVEISVPAVAPASSQLDWVPLVGRDKELAEIAAEWHKAQVQNSRLILVTGPAGMGKTRLVAEAIQRIPGPEVTVITGNCYAMEAGTPYQLISDLMQKAVEHVAGKLDPITQADLAPLVPALGQMILSEPSSRVGVLLDTGVRLQDAVTQVIRLLASSGLWLVTEDLHWADPASLACLNHALRRCHDLPLMVLATLRDEEVSFDSPLMDWPTSSIHAPAPTTRIQLPPLPPEHLHRLLAQFGDDLSELTHLLYRETAGNPFFVVETLRALVEQDVLYQDVDERWSLRAGALPYPAELPMSDVVLGVIRGRIRRLSRAAQEVLTTAAVIEHDIPEKLLATLVDPSLSLDLALDEILRASILEECTPGVYEFTHIKVREIIYADTSAPRRRFLHRRTAEALAQHNAADNLAHTAKLTYHYTQAREWTQGLIHAWQAAQTAQQTGALAEANRYAEVAQSILDEHWAELDPNTLPVPLAAIHFDVLALRAEFRRQAATAGLYYPPDLIAAIEALLPDVDETRRAHASLQQTTQLLGQGDLPAAKQAAERGRTLYAQQNDIWGELEAAQYQIEVAYRAGDMVTMRQLLTELRDLSGPIDQANIQRAIMVNEMRLAVYEGDWYSTLQLAQNLSSAQETRFDPAVAWLSLANLGLAYMKLGAHEDALDVARQAVEASEDAEVLGLGARILLAKLELSRGNIAEARAILLNLLETPDPLMGESDMVSPALALVRCYVAEGDDESAKHWAHRAAQAVSRVRLPLLFPLSQVAWTLAYLVAGRYEDAHKRLQYPLEYMLLLEDTSPQEIFVLRAAAAQGLGKTTEAKAWLRQALDTIQQQAAHIPDETYRKSFLTRIPLHQFAAHSSRAWKPEDVLKLSILKKS